MPPPTPETPPSTVLSAAPPAACLRAALAQRCRQDIRSLAWLLGLRLDRIHRRMLAQHRAPRHLLLAPRGFGKTTIRTILKTLHSVIRDANVRVLLVSRTEAQAEGFLRQIAGYLGPHPEFSTVFHLIPGTPWTRTALCLSDRTRTAKEPTITAVGVGGPVISKHYDLILCDDVVDEASAASPHQRDLTRRWFFTTLLPCLEPAGTLHVLGTRYHPNDLYGHLLTGMFQECHTILPALDARDRSTWPEHFSSAYLHQLRRAAGPIIFDAQYQNSTRRMTGRIFRPGTFRFGAPPTGLALRVFQGVDLAIATHDRADWFAVVTIGLAPTGEVYVLDAFRDRCSFHEQTRVIANLAARWEAERVGIETNAYQSAQLEHVWSTTTVPAAGVHTGRDKITRAWRLSARFERGDVVFTPAAGWLADELRAFPDGAHDDGFDALDHAFAIAEERPVNIRLL